VKLLLDTQLLLWAADKDPFDRLLLSQALSEGITLLTSDSTLAQYPGPVRKV
jgi:PIN domain nuclease of toxin-antitoxin system